MSKIETTSHYELFHAILRKENDPADRERVKGVMDFISTQADTLNKFLNADEFRLIGLIMDHWRVHREGVSRHELGEIVHRQDKSENMTTILKAYDDYIPTFHGTYDSVSTMSVVHRCLDDYRDAMFREYLNLARGIVDGGITMVPEKGKKAEPDRIGLKDARTFLMEKLQSPLFSNGRTDQGGWMGDVAPDLGKVYKQDEVRNKDGSLLVPTGIPLFDKHLGGLERKTLNFVLGAAGALKTSMMRTMAYNAACLGNRVLFIPTEISYVEEMKHIAAMHAANSEAFKGIVEGRFSVEKIHQANLNAAEKKDFLQFVVPGLQEDLSDKLAIIQPASFTWPSIRSIIEMQNNKAPIDLIVLDYLGRLDIGDARDPRIAYNRIADDVKNFLLYDLDNKRGGAAMVSPCHASRKGVADAVAAEGNYVKEAIFEYSQFEKSCDVIMFTYVDPELQQENLMKIGTCKSRRTADIPAQMVSVDPYTRRVGSSAKQGEKDKQRQREASKQTEASSVAAIKHHVPEPGMVGWEPRQRDEASSEATVTAASAAEEVVLA
jgi:hypothetical protein